MDSFLEMLNGGAVVAMKGKNCVAIASDRRYGEEAFTVSDTKDKIYSYGTHLYVGMTGLAADARAVFKSLRFRTNIFEITQKRKITPKKITYLLSNVLYEQRMGPYIVFPIVAGLSETWEPFICSTDVIGCRNMGKEFVVAGTCNKQLYGSCEMMWEPNLSPDELFETISQALINSCDRDAISGWGAIVYVIEKTKVTVKTLKTRMD